MWNSIVSTPDHLVSGTGCGILLYPLLIIWCLGHDVDFYCIDSRSFGVWDRMWSSIVSTPDLLVSGTGCGILFYRLLIIWCLGQDEEFYCIDS